MNKKYYKNLIRGMEDNILNLQHIALTSKTIGERMFWDKVIGEEMYRKCVLEGFMENMRDREEGFRQEITDRTFNIGELAQYTGRNGKPAYIAVNGIVYDVTFEAAWAAGTHFGLTAGKDLTAQFNSCHGIQGILDKLKKIGVLKQ
ncbi:hypothetical protein GOM49_17310 [Clostridium bovifaecis]|uniref:Cytochrome b5 heme-binding domain-containing protein n=1 Tax=Clostridium bovifaecis TaxID=2184719 RepID=A0A6I6F241_9CLOT|nr:hypothetical protein GOM49_17310 [Clostridium bovifaecis]